MNDEQFNFVKTNLSKIRALKALEESFINEISRRVIEKTGTEIRTPKAYNWNEGPALRFSYHEWISTSEIIMFIDLTGEKPIYSISTYIDGLESILDKKFKEILNQKYDKLEKWNESKRWQCYKFSASYDLNDTIQLIPEFLQALDAAENTRKTTG